MNDRAIKDLTRDLRALTGQLRRLYNERFRNAGADLIVTAGRAGVGRVGQPPVAVLQLTLEMDVDGYVEVASFDVAKKNPGLGWQRAQDVSSVRERASTILEGWTRRLE
jgi:hypothetical protein